MRLTIARFFVAAAALCGASACLAAGGHHSVDDAGVLKNGECEAESWFTRAQDRTRLLHAGVNCGLGGWLELGGAGVEGGRHRGFPSQPGSRLRPPVW